MRPVLAGAVALAAAGVGPSPAPISDETIVNCYDHYPTKPVRTTQADCRRRQDAWEARHPEPAPINCPADQYLNEVMHQCRLTRDAMIKRTADRYCAHAKPAYCVDYRNAVMFAAVDCDQIGHYTASVMPGVQRSGFPPWRAEEMYAGDAIDKTPSKAMAPVIHYALGLVYDHPGRYSPAVLQHRVYQYCLTRFHLSDAP